jgi:hypothetical protein
MLLSIQPLMLTNYITTTLPIRSRFILLHSPVLQCYPDKEWIGTCIIPISVFEETSNLAVEKIYHSSSPETFAGQALI